MCGRYFLARENFQMKPFCAFWKRLRRGRESVSEAGNIFPTDAAPALALGRILTMRWGFPGPAAGRWSSMPAAKRQRKSLCSAARSAAFASQRLLRVGRGKAQVRFHPAGRGVHMAGLWRPGADGVKRFVILTREAPAPVRRIHPRMPVLFEGGMRRAWLDAKNPLPDLLRAAVDDVDCAEAQQG